MKKKKKKKKKNKDSGRDSKISRLFYTVEQTEFNNILTIYSYKKAIEKGDIVEVVKAIHCSPEESIGIQGIVTSTDVYEVDGIIKVKFPVVICDSYCWNYSEDELKLVKKG